MHNAIKTLRAKQAKRKAARARKAFFAKAGVWVAVTVGSIAGLAAVGALAAMVGYHYTVISPIAGV